MAEEAMVTVNLPQARIYRGRAYGPGREVEVPAHVARALGLTAETSPSDKGSKGKK